MNRKKPTPAPLPPPPPVPEGITPWGTFLDTFKADLRNIDRTTLLRCFWLHIKNTPEDEVRQALRDRTAL